DMSIASLEAMEMHSQLVGFLTFASGGIPRKCVQLLLKYQHKEDDGSMVLRFDQRARRTIAFYNNIADIMSRRAKDVLGEYFENYDPPDRDRARRCMIASVREIISKGAVALAHPLITMPELAESLLSPRQQTF